MKSLKKKKVRYRHNLLVLQFFFIWEEKKSLSASCKQNSHWKQDQEGAEKNNQGNLQQSYLKLKRELSLKNGKLDSLLQFLFFFINFITLLY